VRKAVAHLPTETYLDPLVGTAFDDHGAQGLVDHGSKRIAHQAFQIVQALSTQPVRERTCVATVAHGKAVRCETYLPTMATVRRSPLYCAL